MSAGIPAGLEASPYQAHIPVKADRDDSAAIAEGDVVQFLSGTSADGISVKQPATSGLNEFFAGVMTKGIDHGAFTNTGCVREGVVRAKVRADSAGTVGAYLTPLNGKDYFGVTADKTNIILLTNLTSNDLSDSVVYGPVDGTGCPKVWLMGRDGRVDYEIMIDSDST